MILSGQSIRFLRIVNPFHERSKHRGMSYGLSAAGYDVRLRLKLPEEYGGKKLLCPGEHILASTIEAFAMPNDVLGVVHDKSTWARMGLAVQNTVIEPGWRGFLTLELSNHGSSSLELHEGDPIAQVVFHMLDQPAERPYSGKYQDQQDGPQEAIFE